MPLLVGCIAQGQQLHFAVPALVLACTQLGQLLDFTAVALLLAHAQRAAALTRAGQQKGQRCRVQPAGSACLEVSWLL